MTENIASIALLILFFTPNIVTAAFKLPDTGQTKCYQTVSPYAEIPCAGTGQDGAYSINPMSYTDNGNGTVTDNNTGLMWQKADNNQTYNWYQASGSYDSTYNPSAQNVCRSLDLADYTDWRLPSLKELVSIVDFGVGGFEPTIKEEYFPNTSLSYYWTSNDHAGSTIGARAVNFWGARIYNYPKEWTDSYVRCVRGGQETSILIDNGNGTVTDNNTGLMWQKGELGQMTFGSALSHCELLSLGGYSDWRLPNIKELESLIDESQYDPAIKISFFPNAIASSYWSSTTNTSHLEEVRCVDFEDGTNNSIIKDYGYYARCVRGGHGLLVNILISFSGTGNGTVTASGIRSGESDSFSSNQNSSEYFDFNTSVNLHATPAEYSFFSGWSGACSGTGDCIVLMDSDKSVTATFNSDTAHSVRIGDTSMYYSTLQDSYNGVPSSGTIKVWGTVFPEDLNANINKLVLVEGGYNSSYTSNNGYTTLDGVLTISLGTLVIENLTIR
jgi:hypothetical protein